MDNNFKVSGMAFTLYGGFTVFVFLAVYLFGASLLSNIQSLPTHLFFIISVLFVINFLALLSGIYLLKNNEVVHKVALPLSIVLLFSVPFGTITGAIYLVERYKST